MLTNVQIRTKLLLLVLTSVLGYELKTAVGTSVFIMTFTALTGAIFHFYIGGKPDIPILIACVTGILLCALGLVMLFF